MLAVLCWSLPTFPEVTSSQPARQQLSDPDEIELLELTTIDYEEGKPLPKEIQALDGKRVLIRGVMEGSTPEETEVFLLVTDECGCDGTPKVHHFIEVTLDEGNIGYLPHRIAVTGTLSVGEVVEDDLVISLYRLAAESVR
jgi:hypothetical protein